MNHNKWAEVLNEISDEHIAEAANPKRKQKFPWFGAIAASLVAIMLVGLLGPLVLLPILFQGAGNTPPQGTTGPTVIPTAPQIIDPIPEEYIVSLSATARNQDLLEKRTIRNLVNTTKAQRGSFFHESCRLVLSEEEGNALWSPVNAYMALTMTASLTNGDTRQELLDALGAADLDELTTQASAIWEVIHLDGEAQKCLLANSIWLDESLSFNREPLDRLAYDLYTSVYRADLGTQEANSAIQSWVNQNTGNLLTDAAEGIDLPEQTVLALYSTIWFQARWSSEFHPNGSTEGIFHSPAGDVSCTFINKKGSTMRYFWGDDFGAVFLSLRNGANMWFILPDEGISVDQLLAEGAYLDMATAGYDSTVQDYNWRDNTPIRVNLSVPKFDISTQKSLNDVFRQLGIQKVFDPQQADYSETFSGGQIWLQKVNQAVRVAIDEEGVTAAAYTEQAAGAAPPPEEIMDFILDRPFLFVITMENIPLFTGVVNDPSAA